jgi:hypothetical protein
MPHKMTIAILALALVAISFAQDDGSDQGGNPCAYLENKCTTAKNTRTMGIVLSAMGGIFIISGVLMSSSAGNAYYSTDSYGNTVGTPKGGFGGVLIEIGLPITVTGVLCAIIGNRHKREYARQYDELKCDKLQIRNRKYEGDYKKDRQEQNRRKWGGVPSE